METNGDPDYVEPMRLSDAEAYVYEAIATLAYLGRPATEAEIAVVSDLPDPDVERILRGLAARRLVEERPGGKRAAGTGPEDTLVYSLARRAAPIALPDDEPGAT